MDTLLLAVVTLYGCGGQVIGVDESTTQDVNVSASSARGGASRESNVDAPCTQRCSTRSIGAAGGSGVVSGSGGAGTSSMNSSVAEVVTLPTPIDEDARPGLTWGKVKHDPALGIVQVSCHGNPKVSTGESCNAYGGDTNCSFALPVLCLKPDALPRPNYALTGQAYAMSAEYYMGWAGGTIGVTNPIKGTELSSVEMATALCQEALGVGYRMAEFHDGLWVRGMGTDQYYGDTWPAPSGLSSGGWSFYAFGNVPSDTRFWVYINDQPANCWD